MTSIELRQRFGGLRVLWQNRLGGYCVGLDEAVPVRVMVCLDDGDDMDLLERTTGVRVFSLERAAGRRQLLDDEGIERLMPAVAEQVADAIPTGTGAEWVAVSPFPGTRFADFAAAHGIRCVAPGWDRFWWLSHKANLEAGLKELGLPRLPGRWVRLSQARHAELASEFGGRYVVQLPLGVAGSGTAIVSNAAEHAAAGARFGEPAVRASPYAGDLSFNVNAIATSRGTAVGYPSVQVVGAPALNAHAGGHCGNDFTATAAVEASLVESVREQTARIGEWMAARGHRGQFGLDFVVREETGDVCAVDLNPRWQGSSSLQAQAEARQGRAPMAAVEIAYHVGLVDDREVMRLAGDLFTPLEGAQVFPKNRAPGEWKASGALKAGLYSREMTFVRPALRLSEIDSGDGIVVGGGIPRPGRPLAPGITLLRMESLEQMVDPNSGRLHTWVEAAAKGLYETLGLETVR